MGLTFPCGTTGRRSAGSISLLLAVLLAAGTVVGVFGGSSGAAFVRLADGGAWLASSVRGFVSHVNGPSGRPDFTVRQNGWAGHRLSLSQDGVNVLVTDENTGQVTSIDPATMDTVASHFAGSLLVVSLGRTAYVIDTARGIVSRVDPRTLAVVRPQVQVGERIGGAGITADGTLWLALPGTGHLLPVRGTTSGRPVAVAPAGHALSLVIVDGAPVGVDSTAGMLIPVSGAGRPVPLHLPPPAGDGHRLVVTDRVDGHVVPIIVSGTATMLVVDVDARTVKVVYLAAQNPSANLGAPVINEGRIYLPDNGHGRLLVYSQNGAHGPTFDRAIAVSPSGDGVLTVFTRNNSVWVNDPDGSRAVNIDAGGTVHPVDKYTPDVRQATAHSRNVALPPPIVVPASTARTTVTGPSPHGGGTSVPPPHDVAKPPTGAQGNGGGKVVTPVIPVNPVNPVNPANPVNPVTPPVARLTLSQTAGPVPLTVNADGSGSTPGSAPITTYSFDFGGAAVGPQAGAAASFTLTTPGTTTVTLTVTDAAGNSATDTGTVVTTDVRGPTAALTLSAATGPAPLAVTADASASAPGSAPINQYTVNFGDGTVAGTPTATHTYETTGTFTVTATVTDANGRQQSATRQVTVTGTPGIALTAENLHVPAGDAVGWEVTITNTGSAPLHVTNITTNAETLTGCRGVTIAPAATCVFDASYAAPFNPPYSVTVFSDAPTSPTTIGI